MERRILIPPHLPAHLPIGGGHAARAVWEFSGTTMGTYWRASVVAGDTLPPPAIDALIRDALATVVACMSPWEPDSDLGRYRIAQSDTWVPLRPPTLRVLARALEVAALSDGSYDPTIGRLTDALGFGPSDPAAAAAPGSARAEQARTATGYTRVRLDPATSSVFQPGGYELDLCSIAKGYAVDLVIEQLAALGVSSCFVEIGGEARGRGCKPNGQPWWCKLEPPAGAAGHAFPETIAAACDLALATSGNTLRKRVTSDGDLGHIVNPLPGHALPPTLESVTVLAPTCMEADVFATTLFLLGPDRGRALATRLGLAALFVERLGETRYREQWSPGFAEYLN